MHCTNALNCCLSYTQGIMRSTVLNVLIIVPYCDYNHCIVCHFPLVQKPTVADQNYFKMVYILLLSYVPLYIPTYGDTHNTCVPATLLCFTTSDQLCFAGSSQEWICVIKQHVYSGRWNCNI